MSLRPGAPGVAALVLTGLVRGWQLLLRPVLGNNCRFEPGCSDYAAEALCRHGALRGSALATARILRCHPFCAGGYDPVPPARAGSHRKHV